HSVPRKDRDHLTSLIRASGSRIPIVSIAGNLGERDAFANATLERGPNNLLAGIRDVLVKAEKTPAWTTKSGNRLDLELPRNALTNVIRLGSQGRKRTRSCTRERIGLPGWQLTGGAQEEHERREHRRVVV